MQIGGGDCGYAVTRGTSLKGISLTGRCTIPPPEAINLYWSSFGIAGPPTVLLSRSWIKLAKRRDFLSFLSMTTIEITAPISVSDSIDKIEVVRTE
jgi:hypothetical protein